MNHRGRRVLTVHRKILRRAVAVDLAREVIGHSAAELAIPGTMVADLEHYTRGLDRDDLLAVLGHTVAAVRLFAAEVPVARRDQVLAELAAFDAALLGR